ncbi:MAG: hypothetical protein AUK63_28 [bacterium P3]|nr:MAG: hypothetical protein AUK63_28 [bacterium P3]KWW42507.1 MAG: hypothetical protein F083_411 [bacterium F083]
MKNKLVKKILFYKKGFADAFKLAPIVSEKYGFKRGGVIASELWCLLRYGASPVDYVRFEFYKKNHQERNRYLTIRRYRKLLKKFGFYNKTTYGKIAEYKTFANYIHRPWIVADKETETQFIIDFINKQGVVFAKPDHGDQGKGVMRIKADDSKTIEQLINDCRRRAYVVEGTIEQAPEIAAINPSSVNTVRAFTLLKHNGEVQILSIMLRVGRKGSHVDNWGSGGVAYDFDIETGICVGYGRDKQNNPYIFHPDSNVRMVGFCLPNYDQLIKTIVGLAKLVPQARMVGWDIAITPIGYELVEMNCPGGHDILQAFGKPFGDVFRREFN